MLRLSAPGEYDIIAGDGKSPARVAVPAGDGPIFRQGARCRRRERRGVLLSGDDPVTLLPGSTDEDGFGEWWRGQKRDAADAPVLRHVSAAVTGHEMLDEHGAWESIAGLGEVWFPKDLPRDWAPYRFGHWRWIGPWGWTWIDDMPGASRPRISAAGPMSAGPMPKPGVGDGSREALGAPWGAADEEPAFMPAAVAFLGTAGVGTELSRCVQPRGGLVSARAGRGLLAELHRRSGGDPAPQRRRRAPIRRRSVGSAAESATNRRRRNRHRPIPQPPLMPASCRARSSSAASRSPMR